MFKIFLKIYIHFSRTSNGHNDASSNGRLSVLGNGVARRAKNGSTTRVTLYLDGRSSSAPIAYQQVAPTQATATTTTTAPSLARTRDLINII